MGKSITPLQDASVSKLEKPLVIGEFVMVKDGVSQTVGVAADRAYETNDKRGYAGALVWQWFDWAEGRRGLTENWPLGLKNMDDIKERHSSSVTIRP